MGRTNQSLQAAFDKASDRILELEDEKSRFFDEGIFDIVNSVVTNTQGLECAHSKVSENSLCGLLPTSIEDDGLEMSSSIVSSSFERRTAVEVSIENKELRRKLTDANEKGEKLERKQRAAEERRQVLLRERAWLRPA